MEILSGSQTLKSLSDIVHEDTQQQARQVDLTVNEIYQFSSAGQLDFGGGEFQPAEKRFIETEKRDPEDDYGWWNLSEGTYHVKFNETLELASHQNAFFQPHPRMLQTGITHPTRLIQGQGYEQSDFTTPIFVGDHGCQLKENCRTTQLIVFESN